MKDKGWDDVNQLRGGILNYAKKEEENILKVNALFLMIV